MNTQLCHSLADTKLNAVSRERAVLDEVSCAVSPQRGSRSVACLNVSNALVLRTALECSVSGQCGDECDSAERELDEVVIDCVRALTGKAPLYGTEPRNV